MLIPARMYVRDWRQVFLVSGILYFANRIIIGSVSRARILSTETVSAYTETLQLVIALLASKPLETSAFCVHLRWLFDHQLS